MGKYDDLHNKTIFDFCDDPEVIQKLDAHFYIEEYGKEKYIESCKREPFNNAMDLDELGLLMGDYELRYHVELQFAKELAAHFTE